jgi:hypothetical protein
VNTFPPVQQKMAEFMRNRNATAVIDSLGNVRYVDVTAERDEDEFEQPNE